MKKEIYIPMIGIIVGALSMFYGKIIYGLIIYIFVLLAIIFFMIFKQSLELKNKNILQIFSIFILSQMISISIPRFFMSTISQYALIYIIMFIPMNYVVSNQRISSILYRILIMCAGILAIILPYEMFGYAPENIVYICGEFITIYMIISFIIKILVSNTKYWNKYISNMLDMNNYSVLSVFVLIVIFRMVPLIW